MREQSCMLSLVFTRRLADCGEKTAGKAQEVVRFLQNIFLSITI